MVTSIEGQIQKQSGLIPQLSPEEDFFVRHFLLLTGREDRLERRPLLEDSQLAGIRAVIPLFKQSTQSGVPEKGRCDLFNRILLALAIKPASFLFFQVVFGNVDFSKEEEVKERVEKFRCLCMLEYGSFRFGYKVLKFGRDSYDGRSLRDLWSHYFPDPDDVSKLVQEYKSKPGPVGLVDISSTQLFALGYLASEQAKKVNGARQKLVRLLDEGMTTNVKDPAGLSKLASREGVPNLGAFVATAGIPEIEKLLYPQFWAPTTPYKRIMADVKESCITVDEDAMTKAQAQGRQNAETYFAMHDVDIYVATSMRDPLHFTTNHKFVTELFKRGELADWGLRYFDPTQAYLPDRIQKGLTECLMIKRAAVTIYNAQESDTFGKDSEAAVALAQGKPVIIYVARLFGRVGKFRDLYKVLDSSPRLPRDTLVIELKRQKYLSDSETSLLLAPEKTKADSVELVTKNVALQLLKEMESNEIWAELISQGYEPPSEPGGLVEFAADRVSKLERRALTFQEIHPLSLQASPTDGVARGVIVTRSVQDTARVLKGLLVGTLEYEIVEQNANWILMDKVTMSPVRVVTRNATLTTAFWSEFSREKSEAEAEGEK